MLAFLISSGFKAFIREACLWFTLEIMKTVFPLRFDFLHSLSEESLKKGRQSEASLMNYINQKCNGENASLEFPLAEFFFSPPQTII